jgi:hypothetical protein
VQRRDPRESRELRHCRARLPSRNRLRERPRRLLPRVRPRPRRAPRCATMD